MILLLFTITTAYGQYGFEYYSEWQSGIDKTISRQLEFTNPQFPIRQYSQVRFPRRFSARPQVLLMHEEIQWSRGKNINYQTYVSDITQNGFYINYVIWGPAIIPILTVKWVALVDNEAEIQYVHYQSEDLYNLRQGFGPRYQDFMISYYPRYPQPKVTAYIVGADIEIFDSLYTSIAIEMDIPNSSSMDVRFSTRDYCHIRSLFIAYFISNNPLTLVGSIGAYHNSQNQFLDNSNKNIIRIQRFTRLVPSIYTLEPEYNVMAQGISGYDVHAYSGSTYIRVTAEQIPYTSAYTLYYGTRGETALNYLQASYVLHPPGLPYHYYYKNYDWIVIKNDEIIKEETIPQTQKISDINRM